MPCRSAVGYRKGASVSTASSLYVRVTIVHPPPPGAHTAVTVRCSPQGCVITGDSPGTFARPQAESRIIPLADSDSGDVIIQNELRLIPCLRIGCRNSRPGKSSLARRQLIVPYPASHGIHDGYIILMASWRLSRNGLGSGNWPAGSNKVSQWPNNSMRWRHSHHQVRASFGSSEKLILPAKSCSRGLAG